MTEDYLEEFSNYHFEKISENSSEIKNKINYYFGVNQKHLTKQNLENNFYETIIKNSKSP
jgi:hypothetical protein